MPGSIPGHVTTRCSLPFTCFVRCQGGEWQAAQPDALANLGASQVPAWGRGEMDPLARSQALLALTTAPRTMPCRETERAAITAFVEESLTPGNVYTC